MLGQGMRSLKVCFAFLMEKSACHTAGFLEFLNYDGTNETKTKERKYMAVRVKELIIRYEDDGVESPLSAEEHKKKYRPLALSIHHHCSPPPAPGGKSSDADESPNKPQEISIDLSKL
jgi:hypothetical protein